MELACQCVWSSILQHCPNEVPYKVFPVSYHDSPAIFIIRIAHGWFRCNIQCIERDVKLPFISLFMIYIGKSKLWVSEEFCLWKVTGSIPGPGVGVMCLGEEVMFICKPDNSVTWYLLNDQEHPH